MNDTYPSDVIRLCVCSITIPVSDNELARQYNNLQQNSVAVLLYYFVGTNDNKIVELFSATGSTICFRRHKDLKRLKHILKEKTCKANE